MSLYLINRIFLLCIMAGLTAFALQLDPIPLEAKVYPFVLLLISYVISGILFIWPCSKSSRHQRYQWSEESSAVVRVFYFSLFVLGYILLIPKLGYFLSTLLFMTGALFFSCSKKLLFILPLSLTLAVYLLFSRVLGVYLPVGEWVLGVGEHFVD